jgi:hypothetical protein
MTDVPPTRRANLLVSQDVRLNRRRANDGRVEVRATVECAIDHCTKEVEQCAACARFVRIDVHEAGYTMLCRSSDRPESTESTDSTDSTDSVDPTQ